MPALVIVEIQRDMRVLEGVSNPELRCLLGIVHCGSYSLVTERADML